MASILSAGTTNATAMVHTADTSGVLQLASNNGTTAITVDTSQNVGIGTTAGITTVTSGLAINNATAANYPGLEIQTAGVTRMYFNANNAASYIASIGTNPLITYTNGAERMRIDSSGNLLVGTTTSSGGLFKVQAATDVCLAVASGTNVTGAITLNAINNANTVNIPFDIRASAIYGSTGIGTTASAANAYFNNASNNQFLRSTSALKYKTNIRDLESIDVNKFRPVRYNSLCEADDKTKEHFGIIADEVDAVGIKELVTYGEDNQIEGFQYERLTVVLLKAIQEQQALITALTARITALENK